MDPNETMRLIVESESAAEAGELWSAYEGWLARGGFPADYELVLAADERTAAFGEVA